jgi:ribonucleoside-diphosphate reductase alpha chain
MSTLRERFDSEVPDTTWSGNVLREDVWKFIEREVAAAALGSSPVASPVVRERLHADRRSVTRDFKIPVPRHPVGDFVMHATVGQYPDGRPGELFLWADKAGSLASGALTAVAISLSFQWQHGVPFEASVAKLRGMRFEPMGATGDKNYPLVSSPLDYLARWLLDKFGKKVEGG